MAKSKGSIKTGGRKKGTPNKKSQFLSDAFEAHGIDIAEEMVRCYKGAVLDMERIQILYKIMDYCYPKRRAISELEIEETTRERHSPSLLSDEKNSSLI